MKNKYLKLFASCIPVKGAARSSICDLERDNLTLIPNDLFDIIELLNDKPINEVYEIYGNDNKEVLQSYFEFLTSNELAFYTTTPDSFPKIDLTYDRPELITNAILDIASNSNHNYSKIFKELESLGCKDLQLRAYDTFNLLELEEILEYTNSSRIRSIVILLKYDKSLKIEDLKVFCESFPRIQQLILHSSPSNEVIKGKNTTLAVFGNIIFTIQEITDHSHCGNISQNNFTYNIETFSESQSYNTCLNRKISIDVNGEIKNCPSMNLSYGNININSLAEIAKKTAFQKIWSLKKDKLTVCKNCEFRYVCTDCRAFLRDDYSLEKPKKCKYDPYTATWRE